MYKIEINDKTYHCPESAKEMDTEMYEKVVETMLNRQSDKFSYADVLAITEIMTGIPKELFLENSKSKFDSVYKLTEWIYEFKLSDYGVPDFIEIENKKYFFHYKDDEGAQPLHEFVDCEVINKDFPQSDKYSSILGVKVRPLGEKHKSEQIEERKLLFKKAKLESIAGFLNFFLSREHVSNLRTKEFSLKLKLAQTNLVLLEDSMKSMVGNKLFTNYQARMYLSLIQSWKNQLAKYLD